MVKYHLIDNTLCLIEEMAIKHIKDAVLDFAPKLIMELGTYKSGFTKYLTIWFPDVQIYTFDFVWQVSKEDEAYYRDRKNIDFIITQKLSTGSSLLYQLLSLPIKKILICDNGHKETEINSYAPCLHAGDMLIAHDIGTEVNLNDIEHTLRNFVDHPSNKILEQPGYSDIRIWLKNETEFQYKLPNDYNSE